MSLTLKLSPISELFFKDFLKDSPLLKEAIEEKQKHIPSFEKFALEIHHRLYQPDEIDWLDPIAPENQWAKFLHEKSYELPEFENLSQRCQQDPLLTGISTASIVLSILSNGLLPNPKVPLREVQSLREEVKDLKARSGEAEATEELEKLKSIEELVEIGKTQLGQWEAFSNSLEDTKARTVLREGLTQAIEALESHTLAADLFGISYGNEKGVRRATSFEDKLKMAALLRESPEMSRILELAGKMKERISQKRRERSQEGSHELVGMKTGNEISRMMPHELAKLALDELKPLFYVNFLEKTLSEYEISGRETKEKGPMVVCCDVSGSMKGAPDTWAKALLLNFARLAREESRFLRVILFSDKVHEIHDFDPMDLAFEELVELVGRSYYGGGTNFIKPLSIAMESLERDDTLHQADLLFITDGACRISEDYVRDFQSNKERLNTHVFSLIVGSSQTETLERISDLIFSIQCFDSLIDVEEIFSIL